MNLREFSGSGTISGRDRLEGIPTAAIYTRIESSCVVENRDDSIPTSAKRT